MRSFVLKTVSFLILISSLTWIFPTSSAYALDRRVKGVIKSSLYGAAIGGLVGGAIMVAGIGGYRNILMGASSGLYGGILLSGYILATPSERSNHHQNPYSPRKKVNPDEDKLQYKDDFSMQTTELIVPQILQPRNVLAELRLKTRTQERTFWAPVALIVF